MGGGADDAAGRGREITAETDRISGVAAGRVWDAVLAAMLLVRLMGDMADLAAATTVLFVSIGWTFATVGSDASCACL